MHHRTLATRPSNSAAATPDRFTQRNTQITGYLDQAMRLQESDPKRAEHLRTLAVFLVVSDPVIFEMRFGHLEQLLTHSSYHFEAGRAAPKLTSHQRLRLATFLTQTFPNVPILFSERYCQQGDDVMIPLLKAMVSDPTAPSYHQRAAIVAQSLRTIGGAGGEATRTLRELSENWKPLQTTDTNPFRQALAETMLDQKSVNGFFDALLLLPAKDQVPLLEAATRVFGDHDAIYDRLYAIALSGINGPDYDAANALAKLPKSMSLLTQKWEAFMAADTDDAVARAIPVGSMYLTAVLARSGHPDAYLFFKTWIEKHPDDAQAAGLMVSPKYIPRAAYAVAHTHNPKAMALLLRGLAMAPTPMDEMLGLLHAISIHVMRMKTSENHPNGVVDALSSKLADLLITIGKDRALVTLNGMAATFPDVVDRALVRFLERHPRDGLTQESHTGISPRERAVNYLFERVQTLQSIGKIDESVTLLADMTQVPELRKCCIGQLGTLLMRPFSHKMALRCMEDLGLGDILRNVAIGSTTLPEDNKLNCLLASFRARGAQKVGV